VARYYCIHRVLPSATRWAPRDSAFRLIQKPVAFIPFFTLDQTITTATVTPQPQEFNANTKLLSCFCIALVNLFSSPCFDPHISYNGCANDSFEAGM
jgi:hypothetical protein